MRDLKITIVITYCIAMALAAAYVPWKVDYHSERFSTALDKGYALFFAPPMPAATIDYGKVFLEFVIISAVAGLSYVLAGRFGGK